MATSKPFPALTGRCVCNTIRYRLLTSPLYCYACHCPSCQKITGSAFSLNLNIELYNIQITSPTKPSFVTRTTKSGKVNRHAECPECYVLLWATSMLGDAVVDVKVGTLDFPSLMEPDAHIFVGSKLEWVRLPEGAQTLEKGGEMEIRWPRSSQERLEVCLRRAEEVKRRRGLEGKELAVTARDENGAVEGNGEGEGDKTPTAGEFAGEDDEEFEKRFRETEKALQERLERLSLKLSDEEVAEKMEKTTIGEPGTTM
ncbi:hypothetical protein G6011_04003 [Alternaria panax]|uniref:CENP-V/GFA domain-containing protein n=1 Tax=Alternaria panax TaxID=48097 RepID=A0AAD4IFR9_9PLEO|nr:hypothetical protein G6011_04003 [Alternaria panax]